ncbi:MAG: response regulator transcription factor [Clostridia bacterium]|nr:response regulator transcription factor [Clostridia bacterium]
MMAIKVLIVDDQTLMRDGLKTVLELEKDIQVTGMAGNGIEAVKMVKVQNPDVVLLDIRMPEMDGVQCTKAIKEVCPGIKVLMLTTFNDEEYIMEALAYGACGYLLKDIEMNKLVEAIHDAAAGKMIMPPQVASKLAEGLARMALKKKDNMITADIEFSDREHEIAGMMVQGFTNKQISAALYISEGTVRNYISNIYSKIGIAHRTQAVLYLKEKGFR